MMAQLNQLAQLHASGVLTDEEFHRAKERVLNDDGPPPPPRASDAETNEMAMFLHLSMLCGFVVAAVSAGIHRERTADGSGDAGKELRGSEAPANALPRKPGAGNAAAGTDEITLDTF